MVIQGRTAHTANTANAVWLAATCPGGPPRAKIKKMERALAGRRPARAFGLRSANVGGGGIEVRGGPGTVRGGPWYGPRGALVRPAGALIRSAGATYVATYATYNHADSGF